jgi:hypothetical protein
MISGLALAWVIVLSAVTPICVIFLALLKRQMRETTRELNRAHFEIARLGARLGERAENEPVELHRKGHLRLLRGGGTVAAVIGTATWLRRQARRHPAAALGIASVAVATAAWAIGPTVLTGATPAPPTDTSPTIVPDAAAEPAPEATADPSSDTSSEATPDSGLEPVADTGGASTLPPAEETGRPPAAPPDADPSSPPPIETSTPTSPPEPGESGLPEEEPSDEPSKPPVTGRVCVSVGLPPLIGLDLCLL